MEDYREIMDYLKPRRDIKASDELRNKVKKAIDRKHRIHTSKKWLVGGISLTAVAALLLFIFIPSGISAKEILRDAIKAFGDSEDLEMVVEVRTPPVENFRYIDSRSEFVTHHIFVSSTDSLLKWRVNKGERIAVGNGNDIHTWIPSLNLGWHMKGHDNENILGYLSSFLNPKKILEIELENCINNKDTEYKVEKKGNDIILTVHTTPQGNFDNPYSLNTSISESENIRKYVIEADSKKLKSASVRIISGNHEIEVLRIASINYDSHNKDIWKLDDNVTFVEFEDNPTGLTGLSAEEAATTILNAFNNWNETILDKVMIHEVSETAFRERFQGAELISIGRSFISGNNNAVFVPYTLKLPDSTIQRHNLALQKTDYGGWIVVGGL